MGKKVGKSIWFYDEKSDELFHNLGSLDQAIAEACGVLNIVEGEIDVWSMYALGIRNTVGIYGIQNIPDYIAAILDELGVARVVYFADNDTGGDIGASNLATLLHKARWRGEVEFRKFIGPGIPHKGDANDLLRHHHPDIAAARAALDALPRFTPSFKREPLLRPTGRKQYNEGGRDAINQAIADALSLHATDFKCNGFTKKNFSCLNPQHEDTTASAGWSRDGHYHCFYCGSFKNSQVAEWLNIDWRARLRYSQQQPVFSDKINLDAAPHAAPEKPTRQRDDLPPLVLPYPTPCSPALYRHHFQLAGQPPQKRCFHRQVA